MSTRKKTIVSTFGLVAAGRLLGYGRDFALAFAFGTSAIAEIFIYAFRLQLVLRTVLIDQPLLAILLPRLVDQPSQDEQRIAAQARRWVIVLSLIALVVLTLGQPLLIGLIAPGLSPYWFSAALVGVGAVASVGFSALSTIALARLQAQGRFTAASLVPLAFNVLLLCTVAAMALVADQSLTFTIGIAAAGFFLAGVSQQLVARLLLARAPSASPVATLKPRPVPSRLALNRQLVRDYLSISTLKLIEPLPLLIVGGFASVQTGLFASLYFAERLAMLGPSILGLVAGSILFKSLSQSIKASAIDRARLQFRRAAALVLFVGTLGAACLGLLTAPIVGLLLGHGAFGSESTMLVVAFLTPLIWFIPFASVDYVTLQVFVSTQKQTSALVLGALSILATLVLAWQAQTAGQFAWALAGPGIVRVLLLTVLADRQLAPPPGLDTTQ